MKRNILSILLISSMIISIGCKKEEKVTFDGATDIGKMYLMGYVSQDEQADMYTLKAAGKEMWNNEDAFSMIWKQIEGDFSMWADISFWEKGVNPRRKIGIIIREKLTADSRYADIAVHGDGLAALQYRETEGDITKEILVSPGISPTRIYLERKGNKIFVKAGMESLPKKADAEIEIELPKNCYVGLFVCSHENHIMETGYFKNVRLKK